MFEGRRGVDMGIKTKLAIRLGVDLTEMAWEGCARMWWWEMLNYESRVRANFQSQLKRGESGSQSLVASWRWSVCLVCAKLA